VRHTASVIEKSRVNPERYLSQRAMAASQGVELDLHPFASLDEFLIMKHVVEGYPSSPCSLKAIGADVYDVLIRSDGRFSGYEAEAVYVRIMVFNLCIVLVINLLFLHLLVLIEK